MTGTTILAALGALLALADLCERLRRRRAVAPAEVEPVAWSLRGQRVEGRGM